MPASNPLKALSGRAHALRQRVWRRLVRLRDPEYGAHLPWDYADLNNYQRHFPDTARAFAVFLSRAPRLVTSDDRAPVGVVVLPWVNTAAPWFLIALGLGLATRGRRVVFIWDDSVFPVPSTSLTAQNEWIGRALNTLAPHYPVIRLSSLAPAALHPGDAAEIDRLLHLNLVWELRAAPPTPEVLVRAEQTRGHLHDSLARIHQLLISQPLSYLLVGGGIYGSSGLYLHAGRVAGLRVATVDSGLGWTVASPTGVAAHQLDLPLAFEALYQPASPALHRIVAAAHTEYELRARGRDKLAYQASGAANAAQLPAGSVVFPLSVEWDSSALGRHHLFTDTADWLLATVGHVLAHSTAPVVVRQHPSERRPLERSYSDVQARLAERFGDNPRYHFVKAEAAVNTYALLETAALVLPHVSTIGIEAAAIGKPVILAGQAYYSSLGFAHTAATRTEYLALISHALGGDLPSLPDQERRAWLCYYLNAVCYRVWTELSPQPTDFWRWCRRRPAHLFASPAVCDLLTAIDENIPLMQVRHWRRTGQAVPVAAKAAVQPGR